MRRILIAAAATAVLATAAILYIRHATQRPAPAVAAAQTVDSSLMVSIGRHLAVIDPGRPPQVSKVECIRVYAAAGTGICIHPDSPWSYSVRILDASFATTKSFAIPGLPSRARVSASGRMAAWTTFIGGHSYNSGGFSTLTGILDTRSGTLVNSLEEFAIVRDGKPYRNIDVNYWGVTFAADDNRFYATMFTDGHRYLVEGDFAARTVRTIADNVECPSLSPAGDRIAFKQAIDGDPNKGWRLSAMDLKTLRVTHLGETRSVDDQAAWLDNSTVAYTLRSSAGDPDVWSVPADGSGTPRLLVPGAESPSRL